MNKTIRISITIIILVMIIAGCSPLYTPVDGRSSKNIESPLGESKDVITIEEDTDGQQIQEEEKISNDSKTVIMQSEETEEETIEQENTEKANIEEENAKEVISPDTPTNDINEIEAYYLESRENKDSLDEWIRTINYDDRGGYTIAVYDSALLGEHSEFVNQTEEFEESTILQELFNRDYYYYKQNGDVETLYATAKFTLQGFLDIDGPKDAGLLTNREGNYILYPVTNYVRYKKNEEEGYDILHEDGIEDELDTIKKAIGMEDLDIVQYYQCDMNNDGQKEKLITINDSYRNDKWISDHWYDIDFTQYVNRIMVLNQDNEILQVIEEAKNIDDHMIASSLYDYISFICDINLDGVMDIVIMNYGYEGSSLGVWRFDNDLKVLSNDSYYWGL